MPAQTITPELQKDLKLLKVLWVFNIFAFLFTFSFRNDLEYAQYDVLWI